MLELSNNKPIINRREFLKRGGIFVGGIFANLALPTEAVNHNAELSPEQQIQEQDRITKYIKSEQLNNSIPCDDRKALRAYLEQHNYIKDYTRQDRLQNTPLDLSHQKKLSSMLQPVINDKNNSNTAIYRLLHHLIIKQMRKVSFNGIDNNEHRQLIRQIEETLPQGSQPYTHRYVDPTVITMLDELNTSQIIQLTKVNRTPSTPKIITHHPDVPDNQFPQIYEENGIVKYSDTHAYQLLRQHNIWLRSSNKGTKEYGNNRSGNRTSLVNINASTIDGIINLIEYIRKHWNYDEKEYGTGGTEFEIHKAGLKSHEGGRKLDLGESLLVLIILLENNITKYKDNILIGDYLYDFDYHGPDRHLDITIHSNPIEGRGVSTKATGSYTKEKSNQNSRGLDTTT